MKRLTLLLALLFSTLALADKPVAPSSVAGTQLVSAEQVVELIESVPGLVIIDARHHDEFAKGHIEGALSILDTEMTAAVLARHAPNKDSPLLFYCNGERCLRSSNAAQHAVKWGYHRIYWFRGGWQEWTGKALPVSQ